MIAHTQLTECNTITNLSRRNAQIASNYCRPSYFLLFRLVVPQPIEKQAINNNGLQYNEYL